MVDLVYERGDRTAQALQAEIDRLWEELKTSEDAQADARHAGALDDPDLLKGPCPIRVTQERSGLTVGEAIVVGLTVNALVGLWKRYLLKRLEKRLGIDAIGAEKQSG